MAAVVRYLATEHGALPVVVEGYEDAEANIVVCEQRTRVPAMLLHDTAEAALLQARISQIASTKV